MIVPFIKNINFFELAKFMKIAKSTTNPDDETDNKPLYKLPNSSELLPLSTITSINIPSIGKSNVPFTVGCLRDSSHEQIYNINGHIVLSYTGYINHDISSLNEWSAIIHLSGFIIPMQGLPARGYDIINSADFHFHFYSYDYYTSYYAVVLQDLVHSPTIADNEFTRQYCTLDGDRIRINVNREWMQNNGIGRIFKIGVKNNTVYFYIDDTLIGYQAKNLSIDSINIGEFPKRFEFFGTQYHSFLYDIQDFSIYDKFIFDIPG